MEKCIIFFFVLLVFYQTCGPVDSAVAISLPHPSREPGGCYSEKIGHLKGGTTITVPGKCVRVSCSSDGTMQFASCGAILVDDEKCLSKMDPSKPYPDCCPHLICKNIKNNL